MALKFRRCNLPNWPVVVQCGLFELRSTVGGAAERGSVKTLGQFMVRGGGAAGEVAKELQHVAAGR